MLKSNEGQYNSRHMDQGNIHQNSCHASSETSSCLEAVHMHTALHERTASIFHRVEQKNGLLATANWKGASILLSTASLNINFQICFNAGFSNKFGLNSSLKNPTHLKTCSCTTLYNMAFFVTYSGKWHGTAFARHHRKLLDEIQRSSASPHSKWKNTTWWRQ